MLFLENLLWERYADRLTERIVGELFGRFI